MEATDKCRFCEIVHAKYHNVQIDSPFTSNASFMAVASIGAFIEGWTLIIPKQHILSMQSTYDDAEFTNFVSNVSSLVSQRYGNIIAFEHGSNHEGSVTACGTNHAHLHLVPFEGSLTKDLHETNLNWERCKASEISEKAMGAEYLFYVELSVQQLWEHRVGYLHILEQPVSQFFRKLLALRVGRLETSDYRKFPYSETAIETRKTLLSFTDFVA